MKQFIKDEPIITSAITALVVALVGLAISFGAPITPEQADYIQSAVVPVMAVIFIAARGFVSPTATVEKDFTPNADVVERVELGHVLAGEASELPTNTHVREIGELNESV